MSSLVRMPEILTGMAEAALVSWYVKPGERVHAGQPLAEVETEKALVDYQAEDEGILAGYLVEIGQPVTVGTPIAVLAADGESIEEALAGNGGGSHPEVAGAAAPEAALVDHAADAPTSVSEPSSAPETLDHRLVGSPIVRRLARESGIDLLSIEGTGPQGRVVRRDVERALSAGSGASSGSSAAREPVAAAQSQPAAAGVGYTDTAPSRMRVAIARRLTESKATVPHFYLEADCDVDRMLQLRSEINASRTQKVSVNDFVIKAVAGAFVDVPQANAIWLGESIRRFDEVDIAVAVAIDEGLVTPVLRSVQNRTLSDIGRAVVELAERARAGQLKQNEIEGGVFAISNLGMYGTERFAAIINPPQAGILAVGKATRRPVVRDEQLTIASMMSVTLSGDHRVFDGALAAEWLSAFVNRIENPLSILI